MIELAPRLLYLTREDWGEDPRYPRLGGPDDPRNPGDWRFIAPEERLYNIVHHTVGIDNDATVNVWESLDEIKVMMRRLQVIRPDLGLDVPYNFVAFLYESVTHEIWLVICEGRGYQRAGAHTAGRDAQGRYFNHAGVATSYAGNFEDFPTNFDPWMQPINYWNGHLGVYAPNLASRSVCGQQNACGHRDFAPFSNLNATACPGHYLYAILPSIQFAQPPAEEEDDMKVQLVREEGSRFVWMVFGNTRSFLRNIKHAEELGIDLEIKIVPRGTLDSFARLDDIGPRLDTLRGLAEEIKKKVFLLG